MEIRPFGVVKSLCWPGQWDFWVVIMSHRRPHGPLMTLEYLHWVVFGMWETFSVSVKDPSWVLSAERRIRDEFVSNTFSCNQRVKQFYNLEPVPQMCESFIQYRGFYWWNILPLEPPEKFCMFSLTKQGSTFNCRTDPTPAKSPTPGIVLTTGQIATSLARSAQCKSKCQRRRRWDIKLQETPSTSRQDKGIPSQTWSLKRDQAGQLCAVTLRTTMTRMCR